MRTTFRYIFPYFIQITYKQYGTKLNVYKLDNLESFVYFCWSVYFFVYLFVSFFFYPQITNAECYDAKENHMSVYFEAKGCLIGRGGREGILRDSDRDSYTICACRVNARTGAYILISTYFHFYRREWFCRGSYTELVLRQINWTFQRHVAP